MRYFQFLVFLGMVSLPLSDSNGQRTVDEPQSQVSPIQEQTESDDPAESDDGEQLKQEENKEPDQKSNESNNSSDKKDKLEALDPKQTESRRKRNSRKSDPFSKRSKSFVSVFSPAVASTSNSVVRITNGKRQIALGTVIDANGLILTKLSEMKGKLKCRFADGTSFDPEVIGVDPDTDLALLKVKAEGLNFARLEDDKTPDVGSWLATVGQDDVPLTVGIVSHEARIIPGTTLNSAVVGIYPMDIEDGDGVRINSVVVDSPAEAAGVLVNDVIVGIDDDEILNRDQLMEKLSRFEPGDEIVLKAKRGSKDIEFEIILGKRKLLPMMERGNRQNRMGSTLSRRRGDFPLALQHDSTLNANECGGPVVNLDGRIVGINIARDGRVSSLALPNEIVLPVIAKLKTGKWTPEVVNKSEIKHVEKMLAKLTTDLGDLPDKKNKQEIEFSAGAAVENELALQIKEAKERLKKLQARLDKKKELNGKIVDSIAKIESTQRRIERRREPLELDLKQLKTGIR